jgi:hypothetical protein
MKILFIENRDITAFWEQVALCLRRQGHEIAWLVQNPVFAPRAFRNSELLRILPFPRRQVLRTARDKDELIDNRYPVLSTDRGRRYFGGGVAHYDYYVAEIDRNLRELKPELVVGESTLFHELLVIDRCRQAGIPYVQPMGNRYPSGRFQLFAYDTQILVGGSGETWSEADARALAERVALGKEVPFYMRAPTVLERALHRTKWALSRGRVWWGRLRGDRYNTPSLFRKIYLYRRFLANLERWRSRERMPSVRSRTILYALQQQPEANIDVWGRPYSDQVGILRSVLAAAPTDVEVAVKMNPKPRYELDENLLALADVDRRLCLLPIGLNMTEASANVTGAITVTGTIGFEAIFGKGRCLSLRHPLIEQEFPEFHASSAQDAVQRLLHEPTAGLGNVNTGTKLIQRMVATSFVGLVSDPLSHPACVEPANVEAVAAGIQHALTPCVDSARFKAASFELNGCGPELDEPGSFIAGSAVSATRVKA